MRMITSQYELRLLQQQPLRQFVHLITIYTPDMLGQPVRMPRQSCPNVRSKQASLIKITFEMTITIPTVVVG